MPRFYLHMCNSTGFVEDEEGAELADLDVARAKAIEALRDVSAGEVRQGEINMGSFIEIEGEDRRPLAEVTFAEAVRVTSEKGQRRDRCLASEEGSR
jgi:hypothetical protein